MEHDTTAAGTPSNAWRFAQCFGDKGDIDDITEADIISTVEFDPTGDYLATGDKGGRVVMFERSESAAAKKQGCEYRFHTEFQSHEPEFDYLKSLEIEEKINQICWCRRQNAAHLLLSTNGTFVDDLPRQNHQAVEGVRQAFECGGGGQLGHRRGPGDAHVECQYGRD